MGVLPEHIKRKYAIECLDAVFTYLINDPFAWSLSLTWNPPKLVFMYFLSRFFLSSNAMYLCFIVPCKIVYLQIVLLAYENCKKK